MIVVSLDIGVCLELEMATKDASVCFIYMCLTCEYNMKIVYWETCIILKLILACGCSMFGSVREDCEQMTGRCVCKPGIQGQKCTLCTNHLEILGPNGCYNGETITNRATCHSYQ